MRFSDKTLNIIPALLKAQKEMENAKKDGTNPHFRSEYSTLLAVFDSCKKALHNNGLFIMQPINEGIVETHIIHESGEYITDGGVKIVCARENDPQAMGSAITYAKRYGLMSLLAIASEDDDGEKAVVKPVVKQASTLTMPCKIHNQPMTESLSASGMPYFSHIVDGKRCFGK